LNKPLPAPGNAPAPGAAAAPAPGNLPPLVEPPPAHNEAATIEQIPVAPLVQPPPQAAPAAAIAHYVPATPAAPLPAPVTASDTTPPVKAIAPLTAPVTDIASEPDRELSPESKKLLRKFPAHLDSPAKTKGKLQVDHAKNTPKNLNDDNASVKHEAMGIKIEIKKPRMDMDYQLEQAYNALVAGQTDAAIDLYKGVLNNEPNNTNALFGLATLYHRAGQIDMARPLYARLLSVNPNHRDGLNNFLVLLGDESPDEALRQMQELQTRNPNFSPIPAQMALIYQKMGDVDKANEKMMQAIDLAPENLTYRYNLAIMLDKQKKYDEAAKLYAQIVEAYERGDPTPGNIQKIQQRLTFISSNRP
jgi:Tfp pilus assembly protein PilF